jgi:uncharacterized membrane protein
MIIRSVPPGRIGVLYGRMGHRPGGGVGSVGIQTTRAAARAPGLGVHAHEPEDVCLALALCAAMTHSLEGTRLGTVLSGPLVAILLGLASSGLGLVPVSSPVYGVISGALLPLGVALYVLEVNVANVFSRESSQMLLAFLCGAVATCVGTVVAYAVCSRGLSVDGVNIAAALCASYIGGSVNFAAVIAALGTRLPSSVPAAMAADNLMMGGYIAVLMWLATFDDGARRKRSTVAALQPTPASVPASPSASPSASATTVSAGVAAAFVCYRVANAIADRVLGFPSVSLALVSVVACIVTPLASSAFQMPSSVMFRGSMSLASILMTLFFVSIGAVAGSGSLGTAHTLPLFGFIAVQLGVQLLVSLACGRALGIPHQVMLVACNANVGGAATAVAMCIQKGWTHLVNPALLVASLGYVIGNPVSFLVLGILKAM